MANLREQRPETEGYDVAAHLTALRRHGIEPDVVLTDPGGLPIGELGAGVRLVQVRLGSRDLVDHDVSRLAGGLAGALEGSER